MKKLLLVIVLLAASVLRASGQDDRVRVFTTPTVQTDVPGTYTWALVSNGTYQGKHYEDVLAAPSVEDMGSVQVQVLFLGSGPCKANGPSMKCDFWDFSWVWISHVKPTNIPLRCNLLTSPFSDERLSITPGSGLQEKQMHFVNEALLDQSHPHQTNMRFDADVSCMPVNTAQFDDTHHKCRQDETSGCLSGTKPRVHKSPNS